MSDSLSWLNDQLASLREQHLFRNRLSLTPLPDGWCEYDGQRLKNFASNDYLNLAHDSRVINATASALEQAGVGSRASALVTGRTVYHEQLEQALSQFEGTEAALLYPTGYAANVGTLTALINKEDVVFSDRLNHASLIDGCRLSKAAIKVYHHNDLTTLESALRDSGQFARRWIVTDTVFSMDGDIAPLQAICSMARHFDAHVIVDEAHATGVFGKQGRGVCEHLGVEDDIAVRIGTLSKAVGALGGFVSGPQHLIDWLWNRARPQVFSTALPPAICAAATQAIQIIRTDPERREHVLGLASRFRQGLLERGLPTIIQGKAPIVPVILNDPNLAVDAASQLRQRGQLVAAIRPPTVPQGTSRLRISFTAAHTTDDVDQLLESVSGLISSANT